MNIAAITTASTVTPFTQNLKQPQPKQQTAQEAVAANVLALIEQLEQGHSDGQAPLAGLILWLISARLSLSAIGLFSPVDRVNPEGLAPCPYDVR
jgi:hypothetical protein